MPSLFSMKLSDALALVEADISSQMAGAAPPGAQGAGAQSKAQTSAMMQKSEADVKKQQARQKDAAAQAQANQLYKQYQQTKMEVDRSEQDAASKQDINLYNHAASLRKQMEAKYKAWQLAQQKASGQSPDPIKADGLPLDAI